MESVVAVFGSVARGGLRVTLPTQHRVPALAAGAALLIVLAWWLPVPRGPLASVAAAIGCIALGVLLGMLLRRAIDDDSQDAALRRAEAELHRSRTQIQGLSRRLSAGIEEERRRIAREVHDELGQQLIRLKHDVSWLRARTPTAETAERIAALGEVLDETAAIVRRIASELRPSVLDELGLPAAVEWLVLDFGRRTGLAASLSLDEEADRLESVAAIALFRILQEALTNVAKHAAARRVHVLLLRTNDEVTLEVRDDGRGLRPVDVLDPSRMGLLGMKERAEAFGGAIQVTALPEVGTTVLVRLPLAGAEAVRIA